MPYLSASAVVIHYEEALYQVYAPLPLLSFYSQSCSMKYVPVHTCTHESILCEFMQAITAPPRVGLSLTNSGLDV